MHTWNIGETNVVEYTLPIGFEEAESDWVGIFKVRFDCYPSILSLIVSIASLTISGEIH